jgi:hypothetical protein
MMARRLAIAGNDGPESGSSQSGRRGSRVGRNHRQSTLMIADKGLWHWERPADPDRDSLLVNIQANKSGIFHSARLLCMRLCAGQPA